MNTATAKEVAEYLYNFFASNGALNVSCSSTFTDGGFFPAASEYTTQHEINNIGFANKAIHSIGYETTQENKNTDKKAAVYVYISKGITKKDEHIEYEIKGCPIRLRRLSTISIKPEAAQFTTNSPLLFRCPSGEIACGSSCSLSTQSLAGTMGALVKIQDDKNLYLLSNNHVFGGCNHAPRNSIITMPAPVDSGIGIAPHEVGRLSKVIALNSGNPDFVPPCEIDAAIGKVTYNELVTSWQGTISEGYDSPSNITPLVSGMKVKKFGRTTGLTHGTVEAKIVGCAKIPYKAEGFNAIVYFQEFWMILGENNKPFALAGDSGSLVITEDESAAVGIVFANDNRYGCILPIQNVLNKLGVSEIVTKYRIPNTNTSG